MNKISRVAIISFTLFLLFFNPNLIFSEEVTSVTIFYPDKSTKVTFYQGNQEIATIEGDAKGNLIKLTGKIPDGVVKEYYPNVKIYSESDYFNNKPKGTMKFYNEKRQLVGEIEFKDAKPGPYKPVDQGIDCKEGNCKKVEPGAIKEELKAKAENK